MRAFRGKVCLGTRQGSWPGRAAVATLALSLFVGVFEKSSQAAHFFYTDFDNTLIETRRAYGGIFPTFFRLFRITQRANVLQPVPTGPMHIDVSPRDFLRLVDRNNRSLLAQGEGQPGDIGKKFKLEDGRVIEPAYYMVVEPQTFEGFLPAPAEVPKGYMAQDFEKALAADPTGKGIRGETWPMMQLKLAEKNTVNEFGIISARGHTSQEWLNGFEQLLNNKEKSLSIANLPNSRNIHGMSSEDYTVLTTSYSITTRKVEFLKQFIFNLRRVRLTDRDLTLNADGTGRDRVHTLIMADDAQGTVDAVVDLFRAQATRQAVPVKLIVWNTGFEEEVKARKRPKIAVMRTDGTFRAATVEDLVGAPEYLSETQKKILPQIERIVSQAKSMDCGVYLINDGTDAKRKPSSNQ